MVEWQQPALNSSLFKGEEMASGAAVVVEWQQPALNSSLFKEEEMAAGAAVVVEWQQTNSFLPYKKQLKPQHHDFGLPHAFTNNFLPYKKQLQPGATRWRKTPSRVGYCRF